MSFFRQGLGARKWRLTAFQSSFGFSSGRLKRSGGYLGRPYIVKARTAKIGGMRLRRSARRWRELRALFFKKNKKLSCRKSFVFVFFYLRRLSLCRRIRLSFYKGFTHPPVFESCSDLLSSRQVLGSFFSITLVFEKFLDYLVGARGGFLRLFEFNKKAWLLRLFFQMFLSRRCGLLLAGYLRKRWAAKRTRCLVFDLLRF